MPREPLIDHRKRYSGDDFRRSSRVKSNVLLLVYGQDSRGERFVERTHAVDLNLHGCGFLSRHYCLPGSFVTLRFGGDFKYGKDKVVRAQVKRSDPQPDSRRMSIGVELGIPGNVWSYTPVPLDWLRFLGSAPAPEAVPPAVPILVARTEPVPEPPPTSGQLPGNQPVEIQFGPAPVTPDSAQPSPPFAAHGNVNAQHAAVRAAVEQHLEPAIARALSTLDLQARAAMRQMRETSEQYRPQSTHPVHHDLDKLLNDRLADLRANWDLQLDGYLLRMEQCAQRAERHAALAERKLAAAQDLVEKTLQDFSSQLEEQVNYAVKRAAEAISQRATLSVDRQLMRLTEDAHFVAREINSTLEADSSAARAEMEKTLRSVLEELRSQSDAQAKFLAVETRRKVAAALAALEAEHLALCETRMKTMDSQITQTGAKVTAEFRQGLRSFFYSCLVAAASAVEEYSKTTLDGLSSNSDPLRLPKP